MKTYIYFVVTCGVISVGRSRYPESKVRAIQRQTNARVSLRGMVPGTQSDKRRILYVLRHRRVSGPWFEMTQHVELLIRHLLYRGAVPEGLSAIYMKSHTPSRKGEST